MQMLRLELDTKCCSAALPPKALSTYPEMHPSKGIIKVGWASITPAK